MLAGLWTSRNTSQVKTVMVIGSSLLLALSVYLVFDYIGLRKAGETAQMLYTSSFSWYGPLNICFSLGVDGISVVMLLLSSIIVFTGTFASWKLKPMTKEYFLWYTLLTLGVYGFFITVDMFTMFMFYEVALIPMYLLIFIMFLFIKVSLKIYHRCRNCCFHCPVPYLVQHRSMSAFHP